MLADVDICCWMFVFLSPSITIKIGRGSCAMQDQDSVSKQSEKSRPKFRIVELCFAVFFTPLFISENGSAILLSQAILRISRSCEAIHSQRAQTKVKGNATSFLCSRSFFCTVCSQERTDKHTNLLLLKG